ncbi:MAG TPA: ATP-binding protein, partial [Thermoanaerobaculia bacterium]|nr:ATP-binding protein [Thermoanaerobaculia bacterium]
FEQLVHPSYRAATLENFHKMMHTSQSTTTEFTLLGKQRQVIVEVSGFPQVVDGTVVEIYGFARDVSAMRLATEEGKKLEAKLEQAHRLSSLGRLAATVAHEFNNVLMGISPFVEVLRRSPQQDRIDAALGHIGTSVKRGRRITEDILRFTQPAEPVRASVDVNECVFNVVTEMRPLLPEKIAFHVDCDPLRIEADPNQMHQIITNLVLNARDAMPDGGTITITARHESADARFSFGVVDDPSRHAHLIVRDTGSGMSEATLRHAFEPLFTTKKSGTGLGLAVTHQVVLRHGGEIFIESQEGEGTTFHLFLPLLMENVPVSIAEPAGEHPAELDSLKILLVEDDFAVATGLTAVLEIEGFMVQLAPTGQAALYSLSVSLPDVVMLDVGLPDMEGTAVYARIASLYPDLPVIFSTGHGDRSQLEEVLARPNVTYLLKPYELETLLDAIAKVTSSRS